MYTGAPQKDKGAIARVVITIIALAMCGYQIYIGIVLLNSNQNAPREVTDNDLLSLTVGEEIQGTLHSIVMEYQGEDVTNGVDVQYFLMRTDSDKLISVRVQSGSQEAGVLGQMLNHEADSFEYRGRVHQMSTNTGRMLNLQLVSKAFLSKMNIKGSVDDVVIRQVIDVVPATAKVQQSAIVATFLGAGIMLLVAVLVSRKLVVRAIESFRSRNGKYVPEYEVTLDDLTFENEGYYEGNEQYGQEFYVNTEFNIFNEGSTNLSLDADDPQNMPEKPKERETLTRKVISRITGVDFSGEVHRAPTRDKKPWIRDDFFYKDENAPSEEDDSQNGSGGGYTRRF